MSHAVLPMVAELNLPPWQAYRAVVSHAFPLFLDSSLRHAQLGRYSYVTAEPFLFLKGRGDRLETLRGGRSEVQTTERFLPALAQQLARFACAPRADLPPFQGGLAGLFGYDLCHQFERLPRHRIDEFQTSDLAVGFYDWVYAFDHERERGWLISTGFPETSAERRCQRTEARLNEARSWLRQAPIDRTWHAEPIALVPQHPLRSLPELTSNFSRPAFEAAVRRAIEYVHAGDCFQVNLAQRLVYPQRQSPIKVYERLRERNPAPFGGCFDLGDFLIASASPERFLRVDSDGAIETRPIKGTRPRGSTPAEDERLADELSRSAKDRAENIMIVDLLRNDLGRVCAYGSIDVPALCEIESYETVHHLVSQVHGRLRPGKAPLDLLRAAFPGGSVTGAPKIRAMQIIAELEPTARGPYCGSLGFISFTGAMDTNILIRTFTIGKGWVQFPVGGGIVADSDPEREYFETLDKAEGMLRALE